MSGRNQGRSARRLATGIVWALDRAKSNCYHGALTWFQVRAALKNKNNGRSVFQQVEQKLLSLSNFLYIAISFAVYFRGCRDVLCSFFFVGRYITSFLSVRLLDRYKKTKNNKKSKTQYLTTPELLKLTRETNTTDAHNPSVTCVGQQ